MASTPNTADDHEHHDPARGRCQVAARDVVDDGVVDRERAAVAQDQQHDALPEQQPGQRHDERRQAEPGDDQSLNAARSPRRRAARRAIAAHHGQPYACLTNSAMMTAPMPRRSRSTGRSRRAAGRTPRPSPSSMNTAPWIKQVDEVAGGQEVRVERLEQDRDEEQAADDRQDPLSPALIRAIDDAQVLAERAGDELGGTASSACRAATSVSSSGGISGPVGSSTFDTLGPAAVRRPPPRAAATPGRHQVDHDLAVDLGRRPHGDHAAEIEHRDAVGDLEHVVHVVRDDQHREPHVGEPPDQARAPSPSARRRAPPSARP